MILLRLQVHHRFFRHRVFIIYNQQFQGAQKIALPYTPNQKLTVKQLLSHFSSMDTTKTPKELFAADIQKDLLLLEEQEGSVNFKFGVVYMKSGQKCDDEMLSNGKIWSTIHIFILSNKLFVSCRHIQRMEAKNLMSFWVYLAKKYA